MSYREITIAILSIILSVSCAETKFESTKRSIAGKSAEVKNPETPGQTPILNPEDPDAVIDNLGDGTNIGDLVGDLLGTIGGFLGSLLGNNPSPEIPETICADNLNIVMVLDSSDSMDAPPGLVPGQPKKIDSVKSVIINFVNDLKLKTGDQVGLVAYHQRVLGEATVMSASKDAVINKVSTIATFKQPNPSLLQHNTNMAAGLNQAASMTRNEDGVANVVILLSDGFPNLPRGNTLNPFDNKRAIEEAGKAAQNLQRAGSVVFTVGFDFENDGNLLRALASKSDYHFKASNAQSLKTAYQSIEDRLCR